MRLSSVCYLNEPKDCSVCIHCSGELRTYNISEVLFGLWPVEMIPIRMAPWYHIGLPHQYCQMYCIFYLASLESCKVNGSGWQINTSCITCLFSFLQLPHSFLQHGGSDMKWVDGGKPLFKVSTFVVSTVNTQVSALSWDLSICSNTENPQGALVFRGGDSPFPKLSEGQVIENCKGRIEA